MPKIKTPQDRREDALLGAIGRCRGMLRIETDQETARMIGMTARQYNYAKERNFQGISLCDFAKMARVLGFTSRELCAIVGIPYCREEGGA